MITLGIFSEILGLIAVLVAGIIWLPKIFVTDEELKLLGELPVELSTSNLTGEISRETLPAVVIDGEKLNEYRRRYMDARKEEREKGKNGLCLLVIGFAFQVLGVILIGLAA